MTAGPQLHSADQDDVDQDDVDQVAVDRACDGDRTTALTSAEVAAVVATCRHRGLSGAETAQLLGVHPRTVFRIRAGDVTHPAPRPGTPPATPRRPPLTGLQPTVARPPQPHRPTYALWVAGRVMATCRCHYGQPIAPTDDGWVQ